MIAVMHDCFCQSHNVKDMERLAIIDSLFYFAKLQGMDPQGRIKYLYHFSDREHIPIMELGAALEKDSIEVITIYQDGKKWRLKAFRNEALSRESMLEREKRLRWQMFKYKVDNYDGFKMQPADVDFSHVTNDAFLPFITNLNNEDLFNVAMRLDKIKDYRRSVFAFHELVKREFKQDTSAYKMGTALVGTHEYIEGIEFWGKATQLNPKYLEAYINLGKLFFENSHWKKALANFQQADRLKPNDDVILYNISKSLIKLERYNEAYATIHRAVKINRENRYARGVLLNLKSPEMKKLRKKNPTK